jgi:catechol-2,3-dioxygenase
MAIDRRAALLIMAGVPGAVSAAIDTAPGERLLAAADAASPNPAPAAPAELPAERVVGIGGLFFRANDPKTLAQWYFENLGISLMPSGKDSVPWHTEAGVTVFAPFPSRTKYFGPLTQMWMVNFRVRDLDKMAAQLRSKGIEVEIDAETYPHGRFAHLHDPEGNPIELWQPAS